MTHKQQLAPARPQPRGGKFYFRVQRFGLMSDTNDWMPVSCEPRG